MNVDRPNQHAFLVKDTDIYTSLSIVVTLWLIYEKSALRVECSTAISSGS